MRSAKEVQKITEKRNLDKFDLISLEEIEQLIFNDANKGWSSTIIKNKTLSDKDQQTLTKLGYRTLVESSFRSRSGGHDESTITINW